MGTRRGSETDGTLITRAAQGSRDAFGVLYDRHAPAVTTVARRVLNATADVDDLVHDVFLEAWSHAGDYDPARGSVRAWLLVRTRSRCLDRQKSPAFSRRNPLNVDPIDWSGRTERIEAMIDRAPLSAALGRLPEEQRISLLLGLCEGLSSAEIAERLHVPIGTVKSRVHAAMQRLRSELVGPNA